MKDEVGATPSAGPRAGRLMVIIPDSISALAEKGELSPRYYNPGDLFSEVDLVLVNDDRPDPAVVQHLVGSAEVRVHNLVTSPGLFVRTLGWRPALLESWASTAVELARARRPDLVRCHAAHLNAFAARQIKRALGTPYVVSLHINPDRDLREHPKREGTARQRLALRASRRLERAVLRDSDCVVCVYRFIKPYAEAMGAPRIEVIYNVIDASHVVEKQDYALKDPPSAVLAGRQFSKKDPRPVVEAMASIPELRCTFVGDGPLHEETVALAAQRGVADRCTFLKSMRNADLVSTMHQHDLSLSVNEYGGVSKVELESALVGMPIVTNAHPDEEEPEVLGRHCIVVENTGPGWVDGLRRGLSDEELRRRLGEGVRVAAAAVRGDRTEATYVALYRELVGLG